VSPPSSRKVSATCAAGAEEPIPLSRPFGIDVRTYARHHRKMKRTATDLRAHLYEVLDHVAKTGEPVHVQRGDVELSIVRRDPRSLPKRKPRTIARLVVGNPDDLVHVEWPWSRGKGL
jgi:hypothetical protein